MKTSGKTVNKTLLAILALTMAGQYSLPAWLGTPDAIAAPTQKGAISNVVQNNMRADGIDIRLNALHKKARSNGKVSVIVQFDNFQEPLPELSEDEQLARHEGIKNSQEQIIKHFSKVAARVGNIKKFQHIPYIALTVDDRALTTLQDSPLVLDVMEDELSAPSMAETIPLTKTDTNAWGSGLTGSGQTIAILDTGVDKTHPFLAGKVVSEACYSTTGTGVSTLCPDGTDASTASGSGVNCNTSITGCAHGTHVAGIAAGKDPGGLGYNGVAKDADLIAIQVFSRFEAGSSYCGTSSTSPCALTYTSDQILALERVYSLSTTYSIAAVNMSLGGGQYTSPCDTDARKAAIDNLRSAGIAVIIASGNDGYKTAISAPACISSAVSVGSTCDATSGYCSAVDAVASYSNISPYVSLLAPGSVVTSSVPGGSYANYNGTSMATPHVAGAWAIRKQWDYLASVDTVLQYFKNNGVTINDTRSGGTVTGMKRLQFAANGSTYTLSVTKSGSGTVTSTPSGINCGSTCSADFNTDTSVTLSASPSAGYTFSGWSGACTGTGSCIVPMNANKSVTATFTAIPYNLSVSKSGNGTVTSSPAGINCGATCSAAFNSSTSVTLSAAPSTGYTFSGWSGACTGTGTCTVSMTSDKSVTATFTAIPLPSAPSALTATAKKGLKTALAWRDNSTNETGFKIERSTNQTTWTQIVTTGANTTSYTNSNLIKGTTYYYRVRAYNSGGDSAYSNVASATPLN